VKPFRKRFLGLLRLNRQLSARARRKLVRPERLAERYLERVTTLIDEQRPELVVDVGGGRSCVFATRGPERAATRIIAVDVAGDELALNDDVDETIVADASVGLPFPPESVDLLVSRVTLEHLPDVESFVRESARVLKPGGWCVHLFAGRNAPYALVNRALPPRLARRIVHLLVPGSEGTLGFRAYYDRCSPRAIEQLLRENGFENLTVEPGYEQAFYFDFLVPLYILVALYDAATRRLGLRNLAALVLVSAQKHQDGGGNTSPKAPEDKRKIPMQLGA
jgi:ubiquinone/menaquinone biosynthesis C-methylase UbiE